MERHEASPGSPAPFGPAAAVAVPDASSPGRPPRWLAALQVVLVCGIPTGLMVFALLLAAGSHMTNDGTRLTADAARISLKFFAMASLLDTALVAILIRVFLAFSGEHSESVFLRRRPISGEVWRGLALVPALLIGVGVLVSVLTALFPGLHNVPDNPLAAYMDTPMRTAVFIVVVILAGGVREELQRGFILHRFDQSLGGAWVGLAIFSVVFGLLHLPQGYDAAIAVGALGFVWGAIYIKRRSIVIPVVSHAGFDVVQVLQQALLKPWTV